MDIEPPHHPIESKRDFFIHLFTITCGLFIALTLESGIDWLHHRDLVREARANIRQELEDNRKATAEDVAAIQKDEAAFQQNLKNVRTLRGAPRSKHLAVHSDFSWSSTSDSAWITARDTGALAYMPYAEVQRYADIYGQQAISNTTAVELFRQQTEAVAPLFTEDDPSDMSKEEMARLLHDSAAVYLDLRTLVQILQQQHEQYTAVLNAK